MKIHPARHGRSGITRSEVIIVIVVLATVLFLLFTGTFPRPNGSGRALIKCHSKLKQVGLALKMWADDNLEKYPWQVSTNQGGTMEWAFTSNVCRHFQAASNEMANPKILVCPGDKSRVPVLSFADPALNNQNISYFVGLSAAEKGPVIPLVGDRHLVIDNKLGQGVVGLTANQKLSWSERQHKGSGNIMFTDGSVRTFSGRQLSEVFLGQSLIASGLTTNWLAIP